MAIPASNEVAARFPVGQIPGESTGGGWQSTAIGSYVSELGNLAGRNVGPNTLMKVMAGDQVSASAIYYYPSPVTNGTNNSAALVTDLLGALGLAIGGGGATSTLMRESAGGLTSPLNANASFFSVVDPDSANTTGSAPEAYLTILFFDERFNFIGTGSVSTRVSQSGNGAAPLMLPYIKAPKNGYAYVYLSNVSDQTVYFDNLQVTNQHSAILEEDHYYAYGLKIAGISSTLLADRYEGFTVNKNLFNDKELIDEGNLNWYEYGFRNYDPQIGRFVQLDPLTDKFPQLTPFQYASDDPATNIDLDELEGGNGTLPAVVVTAAKPAIGVAGFSLTQFSSALTTLGSTELSWLGDNQAVTVYNYSTPTGAVVWTSEYGGDAHTLRVGTQLTYQGSAVVSLAPSKEEIQAEAQDMMLRQAIPQYGQLMGVLKGSQKYGLGPSFRFQYRSGPEYARELGQNGF